jgi:Holliday junction resolvase
VSRGHDRERKVADHLRRHNWFVTRAAGSFGCADLVALRAGSTPLLVEVKSTARSPYDHFPPRDRERLRDVAKLAGAKAVLAYWPPRGTLRFLHPEEWPT